MTKLTTDLNEAIKQNLPQMLGEELQKLLKERDEFESANAKNEKELKTLRNEVGEQLKQINRLMDEKDKSIEEVDTAIFNLEQAKKKLQEAQNQLALKAADIATGKVEVYASVFETIFRNPVHRTTVTKDAIKGNGEYASQQYGSAIPLVQKAADSVVPLTKNTTETEE